ncbi:helicase-primase helicase subunit [Suid alphaherpesvirus 1]|uniref:Helicase-primase helicase subunit n=1 Tax=Suid herpesvirus 1 TaxID=10345 RepID=A0A182BM63_SUHV|nr:helicase-primase helicase subunit [Suid alphaherpesvirus 1]
MAAAAEGPRATNATYLNFTSMHGVEPIVERVRELAATPAEAPPPLAWFKSLAAADNPVDIEALELPFAAYLISGNAGSGKSTCIQTLNETMDCVITGSTRVAAQNVYAKLSAAYSSRYVNTIFQEFGFRGNHVQAQLGRYSYACPTSPPTVRELQKRDLVYYWEVLQDISRRVLAGSHEEFARLRALERLTGRAAEHLAFACHGSLPAFARSNVIVIDEAGLLGRHLLTAVVYCWWLINAAYDTTQYAARARPVLVCVGSPTQTDSLESRFEHARQLCRVRASENLLTYLITNRALREYTDLSRNWAIFINNKRCQEYEFGELMKALEYGLPLTDEHLRLVDSFVVPEAYINNPANLQGWTRLYSSHREVSAYMSRLHAHLKVAGDAQFVVFTLPAYTIVRTAAFDRYREATQQPHLTLDRWLAANAGRITNYSQSRDQDAAALRCEARAQQGVVLARCEVTYVLNSQVAVTTRLKKLVIGFSGTFEAFAAVLRDDAFVHAQGGSAEYTYRFLSSLLFSGMIAFYNFLQRPGLAPEAVTAAYRRLAAVTAAALRVPEEHFDFSGAAAPAAPAGPAGPGGPGGPGGAPASAPADDDDDLFAALSENMLDMLYCHYDFARPETTSEVYAQFLMLKTLFADRYAALSELFGPAFARAPFETHVDSVSVRGCEVFVGGLRGALLSTALQTDSYTLVGYTHATAPAFAEELARRRLHAGTAELLASLDTPRVVLRDQSGFLSILNVNLSDFVESLDDLELDMATYVDYGISSKLAMTIARSQGLSLERVAVCFTRANLRMNSVYVAMSRVISSRFLRMNMNPLREEPERDNGISEHILAALRDGAVHIVY